jgi:hypothetical protein
VAEVSDPIQAAAHLGAWIAAGLSERDRRALNRLRLVVTLDEPTPESVADIEGAFARLPDLDDRVHLHVVPTTAVPVSS